MSIELRLLKSIPYLTVGEAIKRLSTHQQIMKRRQSNLLTLKIERELRLSNISTCNKILKDIPQCI